MAHRYADRVMVLSPSTGPGNMELGQAVAGYQDFAAAGLTIGDTCDVCIEDPVSQAWEVTAATLVAANTLARGVLFDSSTGGARIDFGAGIKRIYLVLPGAVIAGDKQATEAARDDVEALITGFDAAVAQATEESRNLIVGAVASIVVDSGIATEAASEARGAADTAAAASAVAVEKEADATAAAALAKAAADNTAAAVTNAAIQRETLAELQALTGVAHLTLGEAWGEGKRYRFYVPGGWVFESSTLPRVESRVGIVEGLIGSQPGGVDGIPDFFVRDETGALGLAAWAHKLLAAGVSFTCNLEDRSVEMALRDGNAVAFRMGVEGVEIGSLLYRRNPPGVAFHVGDDINFAAFTVFSDSTSQLSGTRFDFDENGDDRITNAAGSPYYNLGKPLAGLTFHQAYHPEFAFYLNDDLGFIAFGVRHDATFAASGIVADEGGSTSGFSAAEIAERNASNLAYSEQVRLRGDEELYRPTRGINHALMTGQSYTNAVEGWPVLTKYQIYDGLLMFGASIYPGNDTNSNWVPMTAPGFNKLAGTVVSGTALLDAAAQAALAPGDTAMGENVGMAALIAFRRAWNNRRMVEDDAEHRFVLSAVGVGGTSIAAMSKGTGIYNRIGICASAVKAEANGAGDDYGVLAAFHLQGEKDYQDQTPKPDFKDLTRQFIADIRADTQVGIAGQDRPFPVLTYQTGGGATSDVTKLAVGQAQLELALEEAHWFMVGPQYPYTDKGGHPDPNGYRWQGEQFAKVLIRVLLFGEGWEPVHTIQRARKGREILLSYHVPAPPLVWDRPYVQLTATDYADKGFAFYDDDGSVPILSIEIVAATVVRVVLARDVVGDLNVAIAPYAPSQGNTCLRDSDPTMSYHSYEYTAGSGQYAGANIAALVGKPYPLHNWAVAEYGLVTPA